MATVSYVGSKGTHLTRFFDINQVLSTPLSQNPYKVGEPLNGLDSTGQAHDDCATMATPSGVPVTGQAANNLAIACGASPDGFRTQFPGIGSVNRLEEKASSIYHSLQLSLRRSVGWLTLSGSYTYSHSIDDSSSAHDPLIIDSYDLARVRASSNFDQRHLFNLGYVVDLPFFKTPGLTNKLLGGWQWSGITTIQSGTPFSVANGVIGDNAGVGNGVSSNSAQSYPDLVGNPRSGISQLPVRWLRRSACTTRRHSRRREASRSGILRGTSLPTRSAPISIWPCTSALLSRKAWLSSFEPKPSMSLTISSMRG